MNKTNDLRITVFIYITALWSSVQTLLPCLETVLYHFSVFILSKWSFQHQGNKMRSRILMTGFVELKYFGFLKCRLSMHGRQVYISLDIFVWKSLWDDLHGRFLDSKMSLKCSFLNANVKHPFSKEFIISVTMLLANAVHILNSSPSYKVYKWLIC